jgi:hypothetical protein
LKSRDGKNRRDKESGSLPRTLKSSEIKLTMEKINSAVKRMNLTKRPGERE